MQKFTTNDVATMVNKSPRTIRRMVREGRIYPADQFPGRTGGYLFLRSEIRRAFPKLNIPDEEIPA